MKSNRPLYTVCLLPFVLCLLPFRLFAEPADSFKKANAAYAEGKFQDAVALYKEARSEGLHHWALYFNRSEERRVGKECRAWWGREHGKGREGRSRTRRA